MTTASVSSAATVPGAAPDRLNAGAWLLDRRVAAGDGERVAVRCRGRDHTYAELTLLSASVAAALRHSGVRPEERVLLVMVDGPELVAALCGAMRMGAVPVPLSTMSTPADLAFLAADSRARLAVVSGQFVEAGRAMATGGPELADLVVAGGDPGPPLAAARLHRWDDWLADAGGGDGSVLDTRPDSPAFWLYTSGTTGKPKGAMHRHADLPFTAETYASQVLGIRRDDRCFSIAKLFFAYGLGNSLSFPLSAGACAVLEPGPPTPASVAALVTAERPTLFFATPTFYAGLLAADLPEDTFASVRQAVSAGEGLPAPVFERFRDRFGVEILDGLGSTEATHIFLSNRPGAVVPGSSGTPVPGYDVRLVDDAGLPVEGGGPGHLMVRGESLATGYWCRTEVTRRVFCGEWVRTGDMYVRDDAGVYRHCGRSDDMLKVGGIWVSPAEVEATLIAHEQVVEAAVVAEVDGDGIQRPVAYVVARPGSAVEPEELIEFCRARLAAFKRPRRVVLCEQLPKTATGKIQRFKLRG
ncbi:MAG TPA: benzoate-CoA ligase family protein [Candidatus Dormibacteraeota bacterium]|nr:benzoate-CoA ligase family protein [Candidatus Dormibacteraeota bacterium]